MSTALATKVLVFGAPWSKEIDDTKATLEVYKSAETLLSLGPHPTRIIQRPLLKSTYQDDILKFTGLSCNQRGPNFIIFSAHGLLTITKRNGRRRFRRELTAFDGDIDLGNDIWTIRNHLKRSVVLDSCEVGASPQALWRRSGAAGVIGFSDEVDWVDSTVFVLALLMRFHDDGVMELKRIRRTTAKTKARVQTVLEEMTSRPYKSLARSLAIRSYFGP